MSARIQMFGACVAALSMLGLLGSASAVSSNFASMAESHFDGLFYSYFKCFDEGGDQLVVELEEIRSGDGELLSGLMSPDNGTTWLRISERRIEPLETAPDHYVITWSVGDFTLRGRMSRKSESSHFQGRYHNGQKDEVHQVVCRTSS